MRVYAIIASSLRMSERGGTGPLREGEMVGLCAHPQAGVFTGMVNPEGMISIARKDGSTADLRVVLICGACEIQLNAGEKTIEQLTAYDGPWRPKSQPLPMRVN